MVGKHTDRNCRNGEKSLPKRSASRSEEGTIDGSASMIRALFLILIACITSLAYAQADRRANENAQHAEATILDPLMVVVLPTAALSDDPAYPTLADTVFAEINRQLDEIDGVHIVAQELVEPYRASALSPVAIARELGAATVVESSVSPGASGYTMRLQSHDAVEGKLRFSTSSMTYSEFNEESDVERLRDWVSSAVESIEYDVHPERAPDRELQTGNARTVFLDTNRPERERIEALNELRPPRIAGHPPQYVDGGAALSGDVAAAAAQLATQSDDPHIKASIWSTMTGVSDSRLVQPLLLSLSNDPEPRVRAQAAEALAGHLRESGVREALEAASHNDNDSSVQQAAYYATLSPADLFQEYAQTVMDASQSEFTRRQALFRLWQLNHDGRFTIDSDMTAAIAHFASSSPDPQTRQSAWFSLSRVAGTGAVAYLLDAMAEEPNEAVRANILSSLSGFLDEPGVLDAIEDAQANDTSAQVRATANRVLRDETR